jgi:hypothetical protein
MEESPGIRKYEFTQEENLALYNLSQRLKRLGVLILLAGLLFVAYLVVSFVDPPSLLEVGDAEHTILSVADYALWITISLLITYLSIMVIKLARPLRLIAQSSDADISHLMEFVEELTAISRLSSVGLIVVCALILASLGITILIF